MEELVWCAHGHRVEPDRLTDTTDEQGDEVCDICITHYDECEHCDTMLHFATSTQIDGAVVCPDCEVEHYAYCHGCADAHKQDDMRRERGDWYCESCHEDLFTSCDDCGDRIDRDEAHTTDYGGEYCDSCWSENHERGGGNLYDSPYDHDANVHHSVVKGTTRDYPVTFGVEMETQFDSYMDWNWDQGYQFEHGFSGWDSREDSTVYEGAEIVSPILRGAHGLAEIIHTARILRRKGGYNDESTGQHTTVGYADSGYRGSYGYGQGDRWRTKMKRLFYVVEDALYATCGEAWRYTCEYGGNTKHGGGSGISSRSGRVMEMRYPPGTLDVDQIAINVGVNSLLAMLADEIDDDELDRLYATAHAADAQDDMTEMIRGGLLFLERHGWGVEGPGEMRGLPYDPDDPPTIMLDDDRMGIGCRVELPGREALQRHLRSQIEWFCSEYGIRSPLETPEPAKQEVIA